MLWPEKIRPIFEQSEAVSGFLGLESFAESLTFLAVDPRVGYLYPVDVSIRNCANWNQNDTTFAPGLKTAICFKILLFYYFLCMSGPL